MPVHTQPGMELHVTVAGNGVFNVGGRRYAQAPGRGLLLRGEQAHRLEKTGDLALRRHVVCFDPALLSAQLGKVELLAMDWVPKRGGFAFMLGEQDFARVDMLVRSLRFETTVRPRGWEGVAVGGLLQILAMVRRRETAGLVARKGRADLLDEACAHVRSNLGERLKLAEVAAVLEVSAEHLARTFRKHLGMAFGSYVMAERVAAARDLFNGGGTLSTTDIAFSTGFQSLAHFSRVFKAHTGLAPRNYRSGYVPKA